ncbi:MAG: SAM-dependent methyltransferase [Gammaproteobacteria bacterium]|nr:SAM-dependent methyltransferase [Gammaproteobacteria bacterium]
MKRRAELEDVSLSLLGDLPDPDPDAQAHSKRLVRVIRDEMDANGGAISFARFMEMALYEPGLGYYSAGSEKFGCQGDFVTAPLVSSLFSRCLARQCQQVLEFLGGGDILELGAGSGVMAADILLELESANCLPEHYFILDVSADLRVRQEQMILMRASHLLGQVCWIDSLPRGPLTGVILGVELLDALPVHRLRVDSAGLQELYVCVTAERLTWLAEAAEPALARAFEGHLGGLLQHLPDGYATEFNRALPLWLEAIAKVLSAGLMLFVDYGYPRREYYHPERADGTLLCHYRHRAHSDPLRLVGLQDITASVDFSAVAESAVAVGLDVRGFTTQVHFLLGCGLDELLEMADPSKTREFMELTRQAKQLTLPSEMGERFKVMALARNCDTPLRGFEVKDHRAKL